MDMMELSTRLPGGEYLATGKRERNHRLLGQNHTTLGHKERKLNTAVEGT